MLDACSKKIKNVATHGKFVSSWDDPWHVLMIYVLKGNDTTKKSNLENPLLLKEALINAYEDRMY